MKKALKTLLEIQDQELKLKQQKISKAQKDIEAVEGFLSSLKKDFQSELNLSTVDSLFSYNKYFDLQNSKIAAYERVRANHQEEIDILSEELSTMFGESKKIENMRDKILLKEKVMRQNAEQKHLDEVARTLSAAPV